MKLGEFYQTAVHIGMRNDPRGEEVIERHLKVVAESREAEKEKDKGSFDPDTLWNPYDDTRILYGSSQMQVKRILAGIDIDTGELLLADRLNNRPGAKKIDLVLSHHPQGKAYAKLPEVMKIHIDVLAKAGVPETLAEDLTESRIREVDRKIASVNHFRSVDTARLLDIPFMCVHTPADNCVTTYLQRLFDKKQPRFLSEVIKILEGVPEYKEAAKRGCSPNILIGDPKRRTGKILVDMTGGTEGSKDIFSRLAQAGVGTLVAMHLSEEHFQKAKSEHINVVLAGHISSDTLGLNLLLDEAEKKFGAIPLICCSGFTRVSR